MATTVEPQRMMTVEEWAALPEDDDGELVDGILVSEEMATYLHELVVTFLVRALGAWGDANGASVATSDARFAVSARRGRKPDLTVYLRGARRPPARGLIRVPPSIAVEVVSDAPGDQRRDRVEKVLDYAAFGVQWYWLIDPEARTFELLELGSDRRYVIALATTGGRIESVPGCDGLSLDLDALWARLDVAIAEGGDDDHIA